MDEESDELMRRRVWGWWRETELIPDKMKHIESNDQFYVTKMTLVAEQVTRDEKW